VVLKAGRSTAGARGARSHTAAAATSEVAVQALLAACGAIEVATLDELLDVSGLLATVPLPAGRRVGLVGNSGGPLILAADACASAGLAIPELPPAVRRRLAARLPPASAFGNPVDMTSGGDAAVLEAALRTVAADASVDALMVVVTPLQALSGAEARAAVMAVAADCDKPIVACILETRPGGEPPDGIADVPSPDRAARALGLVCGHAEWRAREAAPHAEARWAPYAAARRAVDSLLAARPDGGWLDLTDAAALAAACGLPSVPTLPADSAEAAAAVAGELGFPVVLKAGAGALVHKTERGGVALGLDSAEAVAAAYRAMARRLGEEMGAAVVQPMTPGGVETIVGLAVDPSFGPLVMFGLGGVASDLLGDRAFAVPPLDPGAVERLVAAPRTAALLTGYRGADPVDLAALGRVVSTVAAIAEHLPEVVELDCNPVVCRPDGAVVVDCKVRLAPCPPGPDPLLHMLHRLPPRRR
jgi:acyl-CoA synthetase (NDP forming)